MPEKVDTENITATWAPVVAKDTLLISDAEKAYGAFAAKQGILHVWIIAAKGEHVWQDYHIQTVDKQPVEDPDRAAEKPNKVDAASRVFAGTINGIGSPNRLAQNCGPSTVITFPTSPFDWELVDESDRRVGRRSHRHSRRNRGTDLRWSQRLHSADRLAAAQVRGESGLDYTGDPDASYFFGGFFTLREAIANMLARRFEIDTLMLVAAAGAAALGKWVECALLLFLFSLGHALEHYAIGRAKRGSRRWPNWRPRARSCAAMER